MRAGSVTASSMRNERLLPQTATIFRSDIVFCALSSLPVYEYGSAASYSYWYAARLRSCSDWRCGLSNPLSAGWKRMRLLLPLLQRLMWQLMLHLLQRLLLHLLLRLLRHLQQQRLLQRRLQTHFCPISAAQRKSAVGKWDRIHSVLLHRDGDLGIVTFPGCPS